MNKVHLLGANRSYDRDEQTVSVNQVVMLEGYSYDSYVVYEVSRSRWGITYHLINLRTRVSYFRPYPTLVGKIRDRHVL